MAEHDLVIRGGNVVDGTGAPARTADVAVDDGVITEVGARRRDGRARDRRRRAARHPWLGRHPHPLRRAGHLGPGDDPVVAGTASPRWSWATAASASLRSARARRLPHRADGRRRGHPRHGPARGHRVATGRPSPSTSTRSTGMPRVLDVAAQVPHAAVRAYVMGERAHEEATPDDVDAMAAVVEAAMRAGAVGFTTSRTILHRSKHGLVPGTTAPLDELLRARPTPSAPRGTASSRSSTTPSPRAATTTSSSSWRLRAPARSPTPWPRPGSRPRRTWRPCSTPTTTPRQGAPSSRRCSNRPTGMLFGLQSSLHPFTTHPTYRAMATLPLAERVARLRDPEVRAALLAEEPATRNRIAVSLMQRWDQIFPLGDDPDYEPLPSHVGRGRRRGIGPHAAGGRARLAARA